jgi:hypothetical protein
MKIVAKKSGAPKSANRKAPAAPNPIERPDGLWDRISRKAYELWDTRGRRDGNAMQDWLDAEQIVMDEVHEARE